MNTDQEEDRRGHPVGGLQQPAHHPQDGRRPADRLGGGHLRGHPLRHRPDRRRDRPFRRPRLRPRGRTSGIPTGTASSRTSRAPSRPCSSSLAAVWIIYEAVQKLIDPQEIDMPVWGVGVMLVSALVNIFVSQTAVQGGQGDRLGGSAGGRLAPAHRRLHLGRGHGRTAGDLDRGDGLARTSNLRWLDPVVAILVALMIMKAAWDLTRESARDLLDVSLPDEDVEWIADFVAEGWPAVRSFHNLRTRKAGSEPLHRLPSGGRRHACRWPRRTLWATRSWWPSRSGCPSLGCTSTWSRATSSARPRASSGCAVDRGGARAGAGAAAPEPGQPA